MPARHLARPVAAPRRRAAAVGSGVMALLLLVVGLALVPATAAAAAATSMLRIAQLDPDQGNLELTVSSVADPNQKVLIASLGYGELSDYRNVEAGDYVIASRKAGSTEPPMVAKTVSVQAGTTTTVATVGAEGGVTTFTDDLSAPDPTTQARVRVINAAAPQLDVRGPGGEDIATGLARGAAGPYATLAPGEVRLSVAPAGAPAADLPVTLGANEVSSVVLTSSDGALRARVVVDAGGPPVVPPGPVHAGFGGAAAEQNPYRAAGSAVLVVLAAAAALVSARLARSR